MARAGDRMKLGEVWKLKAHITAPSKDQININHTDEFRHYDLVPALKIISILANDDEFYSTMKGWDGHYIIGYRMVFGFAEREVNPMQIYMHLGHMSSGCLFRNYECVYGLVAK